MAYNNEYPYTDVHRHNDDWMINRVKELSLEWFQTHQEWNNTRDEFASLKKFLQNYFAELDVQDEINAKLDIMARDGSLSALISPLFNEYKKQIDLTMSEQNADINLLETRMNDYKEQIDLTMSEQNADINLLETRMNAFTKLSEGSTTGDAELADGRISYTGRVYANIGEHIRDTADTLHYAIQNGYFPNTLSYADFEIGGWAYTDPGLVPFKQDGISVRARYVWKAINPNTKYTLQIPNPIMASFMQLDSNKAVISDSGWQSGDYNFTTGANTQFFIITFKYPNDAPITDIEPFKKTTLKQYSYLEKVVEDSLPVNSKIFNSAHLAWKDKDNVYESWAFAGGLYDDEKIKLVYSSGASHVDFVYGNVYMRDKLQYGNFSKHVVATHDSSHSYRVSALAKLATGELFCISLTEEPAASVDRGTFTKFISEDGGSTWNNVGLVKLADGTIVNDECLLALYCTSNGYLVGYVGQYNHKVIVSKDNGDTWYYAYDGGADTLEGSFVEIGEHIYMILRNNNGYSSLHRCDLELDNWEEVYSSDEFNFPAYVNPTTIGRFSDGTLYLLGGSRKLDGDGKGSLIEAIVTEADLINNTIKWRTIMKSNPTTPTDYFYPCVVVLPDDTVYAYFQMSTVSGNTTMYEMIGNY